VLDVDLQEGLLDEVEKFTDALQVPITDTTVEVEYLRVHADHWDAIIARIYIDEPREIADIVGIWHLRTLPFV
jgi:hypothetical protein